MQMILEKENDITYTVFKIPPKESKSIPAIALRIFGYEPFKVTSKFAWYRIKGDFINGKFSEEEQQQ